MLWGSVLTSLVYMQLSSFPSSACWRDCLFPIGYSCLLCWRLIDGRCVGLFLDSLFCSIDLFVFFLLLLLSCVSCSYMLEIKPLSVASYPDIFFPVFKLSFHFVYSFLCCTKLISLIRSHLFIFAFISIALGDWPKETQVWFMSENGLLCALLALWCHVLHLSL